jgi:hypothetical protein
MDWGTNHRKDWKMKKVFICMMIAVVLGLVGCALFEPEPPEIVIPEVPPWAEEIAPVEVPEVPQIIEGKTDADVPMGTFGGDK